MPISDARAWVDVDFDAVRANYDVIRRAAGPGTAVIPMVKADGYGLGMEAVVRVLAPLGPWGFGVATAAEGAQVRALGVELPVLVTTPMSAETVDLAAGSRLTPAIASVEGLDVWVAAAERVGGAPLDFHVEVDTGMGRSGFDWREVGSWGPALMGRLNPAVRWTGCYTHFHSADSLDPAPSVAQWERFQDTLVQLPVAADDLLVHAANSAATLRWPGFTADAVRTGIFLYGSHPAPGVPGLPEPRGVASLRARLRLIREKPAGSTVGYGATYVAPSAERWGTVSIGYGDGLPRILGNRGSALLRGRRVPIIGRVSMDLVTVALGTVPQAAVGDEVTFIGEDGDERITVDEVAAWADTIGYEILTGLGSRLPRIEGR
jgi:alanine racemase